MMQLVIGHTPVKDVVSQGGKMMIDTGCVFDNLLSCVVLETDKEFKYLRKYQAKQ